MTYTSVSLEYVRICPNKASGILTLWSVHGVAGFWPSQMVAEMVARNHFPDEDPDKRYGRIMFSVFRSAD